VVRGGFRAIAFGDKDTFVLKGGNDTADGGAGDDDLYGDEPLGGGATDGRDTLKGGDDSDYLDGGDKVDLVEGGPGYDVLLDKDQYG
jgi:Ca2+-binding RTX toxin-like protein